MFRKVKISYSQIHTCTYAYQGVRQFCVGTKWMIPNGDNNMNSNNARVARTIANERSQFFRPYALGYPLRKRINARAVHFTNYTFCSFEVLLLIKYLFVANVLFLQECPEQNTL